MVCLDDFHAQPQFSQSRHFVWHGQKKSRPEAALHFKADVRRSGEPPTANRRFVPKDDLLTHRSRAAIEPE
jgi:hypothetical protein